MELPDDPETPGGVEELVRQAQRGDPAALNTLISELLPYVGRICGAIALEAGDDATQETMILVMRNIHQVREPRALRAWVRRIAVRETLRLCTDQRSQPVDPSDLHSIPALDQIGAVEVAAVLKGLSARDRTMLILRHVDGLSEAEVAGLLDVPLGTLKSRSHRARSAFRRRWQR